MIIKYFVTVKTKQKVNSVEPTGVKGNSFVVRIKEAPIKGQANLAVIKLLASYLDISQSKIEIIHGFKGKKKILSVSG